MWGQSGVFLGPSDLAPGGRHALPGSEGGRRPPERREAAGLWATEAWLVGREEYRPTWEEAMQLAHRTYEELLAEYTARDAQGIPVSVRERYERSLTQLRSQLRRRPHSRRIGQILLEMGAIDQEALGKALGQQLKEGGSPLLGEVLLRHGWTDAKAIKNATQRQASDSAALG